ncbi:MAG: DUF3011 domain-containing protein [Lysobacterales bacterium]
MLIRRLVVLLFSLMLSSFALAQSKAYAPEDLSRLDRDDQTRVLEREYADQADGARLPDDQLEFYLDQVESGWSFSRIKQDIAESLGGGGGGWRPAPRPVPRPYPVGPRPVPQPYPVATRPLPARIFHCESRRKFAYGECRTPFDGHAQLQRQTSRSACIQGRTWGSRHGMVWVSNGCAADFVQVIRGGANYSVTCASRDYGFSACAWRPQYGYPQIIEQISQTPCVQGRTWGYDRTRGLWVNNGCEARFGTRF